MLKAKRNLIFSIGTVAVLAGLVVVVGPRVKRFLKVDTLAQYRVDMRKLDKTPLLKMGTSTFELYAGQTKVGSCDVDQIDVSRDRNKISFHGIKNGIYRGTSGKSFGYEASEGTWQKAEGQLFCKGTILVTNANFRLKTTQLAFRQADQELEVKPTISGQFYGGEIASANLRYRLNSGAFSTGAIAWKGPIQTAPGKKKSIWKFSSPEGGNSPDGEVITYRNGSATDGEILVKASVIVQNRKTGVLKATGNVRYYGKDVNMSCNLATVYSKEKRIVLEQNVALLVKPVEDTKLREEEFEPLRPIVPESIAAKRPAAPTTEDDRKLDQEMLDPATRRKYPVRVIANKIEYWYDEKLKRARITGSPQARQDMAEGRWRQVWAESAIYDGVTDRLRLNGTNFGVRMRSSRGDDILTDWLEVSTKEGNSSWRSGQFKGEMAEEEEGTTETQPGEAPPPGIENPPPALGA